MQKKYELTLVKNYASNWDLQDALREIIQNAIDQEQQVEDNKMEISYNEATEELFVSNKKSVLNKKMLLLGYTSKKNDSETIGQFGEGLKLALLILNRLGKEVIIYNYGAKEVWTSKFVKTRRYEGEELLTIFVDTGALFSHFPDNDLTIKIAGISKQDYLDLQARTLLLQEDLGECIYSDYGRILLNPKYQGEIFVNGLYVSNVYNMKYGYDIKPQYLKIGRDRNLLNEFDICSVTTNMWKISNRPEIKDLVHEDKKDISNLRYYAEKNISEDIFHLFEEEHGFKIPVCSKNEYDYMSELYGAENIFITNELECKVISKSSTYQERLQLLDKSEQSLEDKYIAFKLKYKNYLNKDLEKDLEDVFKEVLDLKKVKDLEMQLGYKLLF